MILLSDRDNPLNAASEKSSRETLESLRSEEGWISYRETALKPLNCTELVTTQQSRDEFIRGCELLGVEFPKAHQLIISDMLTAGREESAILIPRQAGKTTTLAIILVGRCALRPRYNAALTLTTLANKTGEVFEQTIQDVLELAHGEDVDSRPFRNYRGKGAMYVKFPNGSRLTAKTAKGAAFRGSSYDAVWIDEAGEASPEQADDLKGAILSTFDTRDGQMILTGTAGDFRKGQMLFEGLENPEYGVVRYAIPEDTEPDAMSAWEPDDEHPFARGRELTEAMHPGIASGLTTVEKVRKRFVAYLNRPGRFAREYGGIFGTLGEGAGPINVQAWIDAGRTDTPDVPEHFALVMGTSFFGDFGSLVAVWRDDDGKACGYVIDHRKGVTWLADAAAKKSREHGHPVIFDGGNKSTRAEVEIMARFVPAPHMVERGFTEVPVAHALLTKEINAGNAVHWTQGPLDTAAKSAVRRPAGANSWAFGRGKQAGLDLSTLEAFALGLHYYDETAQAISFGPVMAA
ncbi:terminase family protein [Microbacterium sp. Au-Mic1]|uniref:terminase large subunit domain-containing protein n=1 Tax=Microbacterium sp. Au-Mic1 TaxID=2906457 RepID=UPI001E416947|nr:terminase family protein [Microbacterium sp. Au-Mic1]MCE4024670.1 terminase family protein [Microbacterium sp. Au-Mic1]